MNDFHGFQKVKTIFQHVFVIYKIDEKKVLTFQPRFTLFCFFIIALII